MSTLPARINYEAGDCSTPARRDLIRPFLGTRSRSLAVALVLTLKAASAQEALRSSLEGEAAAESRRPQPGSLPYTFKAGEFRMLVTPSLGLEWNDNVRSVKEGAEDDFILRPLVDLSLSYPVTQRNLLQLNAGVGYQKYFNNSDLSRLFIHSGSELSFDIFVDDFSINLHDRFSYTQDSSSEAAVAGTGEYANINNTAGLLVSWNLQDLVLSLGYDHANTFSPDNQFDSQARSSELVFARTGLRIHPRLTAGVEATASFTTYDDQILNDNRSYSAGVYADWQLSSTFRVQPRVGYTIYQFENTSTEPIPGIFTTQPVRTDDLNSWYVNLTVSHQITDAISYSLSAGREVRLGIQSDVIEDWFVRPAVDWRIIRNLGIRTYLTYEHGDAGEGDIQGNLTETYEYLAAGLSLRYPFTDRLTAGLTYRHTLRSSTESIREYSQNLVSFQLIYRPQ